MRALLSTILILLFSAGCANIQSPPGGEGDKTAPYVEITNPQDGTTNFNGDEIEIEFDDYMNRSKVLENLRITPEVKAKYDWNATTLSIEFTEPLKENTTYAINIGTDYSDYYNNSPEKAFSMIFSTGDKLDSGSIAGKLSAEDTKGKFLFLYKLEEGEFPNIFEDEPDYFVNTGSSGDFRFVALKPGTYRLIAIDDKFQNRIYDDEVDAYGTALSEYTLTEDSLSISNIQVFLGPKNDFTPPKLINANSSYAGTANILFDESLDYNTLNRENFLLFDGENKLEVLNIGFQEQNTSEVLIVYDNNLIGKTLTLKVKNLADSTGNVIADTTSSIEFVVDSLFNDNEFIIEKTNLTDSTKSNVSPLLDITTEKKFFYLKFNKIPDESSLQGKAKIIDGDSSFALELYSTNLSEYYFKSERKLPENKELKIELNTSEIKDIWGMNLAKDTLYSTKFKTGFLPRYSKLAGKIENKGSCNSSLVVEAQNITDNTNYKTIVSDSTWSFDEVTAGKYIFTVYCDVNKDNEYSFGNLVPFEFREPYSKSKEYKVEENWEYNEIILILNE
ncbi:MAG: Ig-like domain-containing protein [Chlorobiota bacterium]